MGRLEIIKFVNDTIPYFLGAKSIFMENCELLKGAFTSEEEPVMLACYRL